MNDLLCSPLLSAADEFQVSPSWQGPQAGYTFTTGTQGTGYYKDKTPQPAQAAAAPQQPTAAASQPGTRGTASAATPAASQSRPQAAGGAAAAARRAAVQQHHQQQEAVKKLPVQVPAVNVAAPKPQLMGHGQEVSEGGLRGVGAQFIRTSNRAYCCVCQELLLCAIVTATAQCISLVFSVTHNTAAAPAPTLKLQKLHSSQLVPSRKQFFSLQPHDVLPVEEPTPCAKRWDGMCGKGAWMSLTVAHMVALHDDTAAKHV